MVAVEQYLKPELAAQIKRLDLRAQMVVKGFLQGMHSSPFHGFSVEFSEHRLYTPGDDPKDIDWQAYAKTERYYVKKFEAETNITGYIVMDLSQSMDYTYRQKLTKFDYCVCLAAALSYLMLMQQDPVGLVTFDKKIRANLQPKSKRSQFAAILSQLTKLKVAGETELKAPLLQLASMLRHRSLIMLMSDLLADVDPTLEAIRVLKHAGHDVIVFHVLDEAEVAFPFQGLVQLEDPETGDSMSVNADDIGNEYRENIQRFRDQLKKGCNESKIDYVPLDTSMPYDKAITEYLLSRRNRF
ncbi:hypothetical protein VN12_10640 [Pirellula sp. SH-Sr6A]|uniref:DUF58 domain-containing protein n=1 Tax=Pirellula sp. SH-Sr6A TaxID=1632865 RepID=UPI00078C2836|nr:DUF58 domain-containing protein [Pirellula sp. SH-Sr6A]AMV32572.1 hypothetical protein VN12_10640 [Pirellula sp. SH-Sr6A]